MTSAKEFAQREIEGIETVLAKGTRPNCGEKKNHRFKTSESPFHCSRCGWNRLGFRATPKKIATELYARLDALRRVLEAPQEDMT